MRIYRLGGTQHLYHTDRFLKKYPLHAACRVHDWQSFLERDMQSGGKCFGGRFFI
jgi:hypothetical protein